jgi:hypothetical protein
MYLVMCALTDVPALWAYYGLKNRGLAPIELVSSEMLVLSLRWEHRVGRDVASIMITLADGSSISSDSICGVLNRILSVSTDHLRMVNQADRDYATQELNAFFTSWLYALPKPTLNPATPQGLSGRWRNISEWVLLASKAGLPVADYTQTSHDNIYDVERKLFASVKPVKTVIIVDGHAVGIHAPSHIIEGCQNLAELSETQLLGIEFAVGESGEWTFANATPFPDLRLGGKRMLDVLESVLRGKER